MSRAATLAIVLLLGVAGVAILLMLTRNVAAERARLKRIVIE